MNKATHFFLQAVVSTCLALILNSCSAFVKSPVPGAKNKVATELHHGLDYQTALTAIKIAIGEAILDCDELHAQLQKKNPTKSIPKLEFKTGNGSLTTVVQKEVTDTGGITLLIPFSGLVGTTVTPGIDLGRGATDKRTEKFSFSFDPSSLKGRPKDQVHDLGVKIQNGISEALLTTANALLNVPSKSGIDLQPREITYTFQFIVTRSGTGKVTVAIIPTTPTLRNIGPNINSKKTDTTTNELSITLPLAFPAPMAGSQPMTFFYEVHGTNGSAWVQSPYTKKELEKVIGSLPETVPPGAGTAHGAMELQGFLKKLQELQVIPQGGNLTPNNNSNSPKTNATPKRNLMPPADPPNF